MDCRTSFLQWIKDSLVVYDKVDDRTNTKAEEGGLGRGGEEECSQLNASHLRSEV